MCACACLVLSLLAVLVCLTTRFFIHSIFLANINHFGVGFKRLLFCFEASHTGSDISKHIYGISVISDNADEKSLNSPSVLLGLERMMPSAAVRLIGYSRSPFAICVCHIIMIIQPDTGEIRGQEFCLPLRTELCNVLLVKPLPFCEKLYVKMWEFEKALCENVRWIWRDVWDSEIHIKLITFRYKRPLW